MTGGERPPSSECVGPVLAAGPVADAIIAAIRRENDGVEVTDRGSYLRVLVPARCAVSRAAIESALSRSFRFPGDLEQVMPSFRGRFQVSEDQASWSLGAPERRSS
jgi:toluene monooxygenase system protein D